MRLRLATVLILLSASTHLTAEAREACVRCDGPYALYNCVVDDAEVPTDASIHLLCITELAKRHGHKTCGVDRNLDNAAWPGEVASLSPSSNFAWPQSPPPSFSATPHRADGDPLPPGEEEALGQNTAEGTPSSPPKTVEELAKQTAKASKEGLETAGKTVTETAKNAADATGKTLKKTGDAIGGAAQKTWRCLTSFFGDC